MPSNSKKGKKTSAPKTASKDDVQNMTLDELDALLDDLKIKDKERSKTMAKKRSGDVQGASDVDSVTTIQSTSSTLVDTDSSIAAALSGSTTPRPSSRGLHIVLPPWLLDFLHDEYPNSKTLVYSEKALNVRRMVRDFNFSAACHISASALDTRAKVNVRSSLPGSVFNFDHEKKDILHYAVYTADLPLVYEYLYLGFDPDYEDALGESVFASALRLLSERDSRSRKDRLVSMTRDPTPRDDPTYLHRLTEIIKLFISSHADLNQKFKNQSMLQLACRSDTEYNWEVISLLLQHGALIDKPLSAYFPSSKHNQDRLSSLISHTKCSERPERICPCWSGLTVSQCHGAPHAQLPYPDAYICSCGSGKSHEACCKKRWTLVESWDPKLKRIEVYSQTRLRKEAPDGHKEVLRRIQTLDFGEGEGEGEGTEEINTDIPFRGLTKERLDEFRIKMIELNLVDPAFAFAMKITRFPLPVSRSTASRIHRSNWQMTWNILIDQYIALGIDPRSPFEIERAAKISQWGGALIRECEYKPCRKVERRDVVKLYQCTKCQTTVYCSPACQTADWKRHKAEECCEDWQAPRGVPSQDRISEYLSAHIPGLQEMGEEMERKKRLRRKGLAAENTV